MTATMVIQIKTGGLYAVIPKARAFMTVVMKLVPHINALVLKGNIPGGRPGYFDLLVKSTVRRRLSAIGSQPKKKQDKRCKN